MASSKTTTNKRQRPFQHALLPKLAPLLESHDVENFYFFSKDDSYYKNKEKRFIKKYFAVSFEQHETVRSMLETDNNLYELIPSNCPVKPYFDLEMEDVPAEQWTELLESFKGIVASFFKKHFDITLEPHHYIVLDSCRINKLSFHLVIDGFFYENNTLQKAYMEKLKQDFSSYPNHQALRWIHSSGEQRLIFDCVPYGANQNFRCVNQSKLEKPFVLQCPTHPIPFTLVRVAPHDIERLVALEPLSEEIRSSGRTTEEQEEDTEDILIPMSSQQALFIQWVEAGLARNLFALLDNYATWINLGMLFKKELGEEGVSYFHRISQQYPSYSEALVNEKWQSFPASCSLSFGTLKHFYKNADSEAYAAINASLDSLEVTPAILKACKDASDTDLANAYAEFLNGSFVAIRDTFVGFNPETKLWDALTENENDDSSYRYADNIGIFMSREFCEIYDTLKTKAHSDVLRASKKQAKASKFEVEAFKEKTELKKQKYNILALAVSKLKSHSNKVHILKELMPLIRNNCFLNKANQLHYHLALKDGTVFDIRTCTSRPRTAQDVYTRCSDVVFKHLNEEEHAFADAYFMSVFDGNAHTKQCFLDIIKSCLCGFPLRFFYLCIGKGSNGKSALFNILEKIFGSGIVGRVSKSVLVGESIGTKPLSPEFDILDKCRIGVVSELSEHDRLNVENLKTLSGDDAITVRPLYRDPRTLYPTTNSFTLLNPENIPKIAMSNAVSNRLIIIPFNAKFGNDPLFSSRMAARKDDLFSYIMTQGRLVLQGEFDLSDEMRFSKQSFEEENAQVNYLQLFLEENYQITNSPEHRIRRDDLRMAFINWLADNKYHDSQTDPNKFTKRCTALGLENMRSHNVVWISGLTVLKVCDVDNL